MEGRIKILILEHDPNDIELLQNELKKRYLNYCSEIIGTMESYENALKSKQPDIIIADYALPSFDGLAAYHIRQKVSPETPFIMVSSRIGEENVVELLKMGVTDFVLKEKMCQLTPKIDRALKDAADQKQNQVAERQLRQSSKQLQKIMDLSLDVICTLDQEGKFVRVSAASKTVWGYSPEELIGKKAIDLIHEEDKERTFRAIVDLMNGLEMVNFENRFIRKDGGTVTLFWSARWDPEEKLGYSVAREATDIKRAEEKIKHNQKRFRTLLQNSTDGLTLLAADWTVIERSPSSLKILGLGEGETSGKFRSDRVHPDDLSVVNNACRQVMDNPGKSLIVEYRFLMPDGSYKWLETTMNNQLQEPAVEAIVLNFRDITERKLAEITIRKSEFRLKQAEAIGHMGNWEMDWGNGNTVWSDELYRIYGIEKTEINPSLEVFASVVHPDDRSAVLNHFEKVSAGLENGSMGFRILRGGREEVRYVASEWQFEFDVNERPIRLFGIVQDITARKLAEIALEKSEEKYRNLFNLSPVPMWVFDVETLHFLDVNKAAITHYGYSKEDFMAMTLLDIQPQQEAGKLEEIINTLKGAKVHYHYIIKQVKKSGEVIDVDIKNSFVGFDGKETRLVIATDISERMKYMQAIKEQNIKLREIAWIQSHVVRAPLARLMGLIDLLNYGPSEEGTRTDILSLILASAHELDDVIREIVRKTDQVKDHAILDEQLEFDEAPHL